MNNSRMKKAGYTACIAAVLYGLPHYWWGLGIGFAFPGDFQEAPDEFWTHVIGYWGMGTLALLAAVFALGFYQTVGVTLTEMVANYTCCHRFCFVVIMGIYLLRHAVFVSGRPSSVGPHVCHSRCKPHGGVGILLVRTLSDLGNFIGCSSILCWKSP